MQNLNAHQQDFICLWGGAFPPCLKKTCLLAPHGSRKVWAKKTPLPAIFGTHLWYTLDTKCPQPFILPIFICLSFYQPIVTFICWSVLHFALLSFFLRFLFLYFFIALSTILYHVAFGVFTLFMTKSCSFLLGIATVYSSIIHCRLLSFSVISFALHGKKP